MYILVIEDSLLMQGDSMTPREIREHLGRVKTYYLRNESQRALASTIAALRGMGSTPLPTELRSALREALQFLAKDKSITAHMQAPLIYQPGQEKSILVMLTNAYKAMDAAAALEDHAATLARKLHLDQSYNEGLKLLAQQKPSEADACFATALKSYKDEQRIFVLMGKALMEAGEVRRALPYLKRAVEVLPQDEDVRAMLAECTRLRDSLKSLTT